MKLLFASTNLGKASEVKSILKNPNVNLVTVDELTEKFDEVEETGETFHDNALLKARYFAELTGLPTLADDSGLQVDALDGAPGVHSNRWHPGSVSDRNTALLDKLVGVKNRSAKFVTVACFYNPEDNEEVYFEGKIKGNISYEESGSEGFGYDPVFIPDGYDRTFAELGTEVKNKLSHRAIAYNKFSRYLNQYLEHKL